MYHSPHFTGHSPGYGAYGYGSPMSSPSPAGYYYPGQYQQYPAPSAQAPSRRHSRRATHDGGEKYYSSGSRQRAMSGGAYYSPPGDYPQYSTPPRRQAEYGSSSADRVRTKMKGLWGGSPGSGEPRRHHPSHHQQYVYPNFDSSEEDLKFDYLPQPSPSRRRTSRAAEDYVVYEDKLPVYDYGEDSAAEPVARRSRARRPSHSSRPKTSPQTPQKSSKHVRTSSKTTPTHPLRTSGRPAVQPVVVPRPVATEEDRIRAKIPAGFALKNWDPTEVPILLLGSVFDANSLGKWIYDWTVFHHGAATPMSDIAGDLWLLMIQLSGKMKRAEECVCRIRRRDNVDMVEDFLESGDRLWSRFNKLLKTCEQFMYKAARRENGGVKKSISMGRSSGCEFVDSIFGRDRELERTQEFMTGMRFWSMRFDANCEQILQRPGL